MGTHNDMPAVLIPIEQDTITFYGHELVAVRLEDGRIAAVLRWLCDSLQLDPQAQLRRVERKTALADGLVRVRVETAGGHQTMPALTLDVLPGYLFTIDESRVRVDARPDVIVFQRECARVLAEHFARKHRPALPTPGTLTDPTAAAIIEQIDELSGVVTLLREHLAALQTLPGQVQALTEQVGHVAAVVEALAERQGTTETQVAKIDERTQRMTPAHARAVQEQVDRIVRETRHLPMPLTYATIYGRLKHRFRAGSYREVPDEQYEAVLAFLQGELARATSGKAPQQGGLF
jgi:hypothetical protein